MFAVLEYSKSPEELLEKSKKNKHTFVWYHFERKRFELMILMEASGFKPDKDTIVETLEETIEVGMAPKTSEFKCGSCDFTSTNIGGMRRHINKMHGSGTFTDSDGETHEWGDVEEQPSVVETLYKCQECDFTSESMGGIRRHISRAHTSGKFMHPDGTVESYGEVVEISVPSKPKPRPKVLKE